MLTFKLLALLLPAVVVVGCGESPGNRVTDDVDPRPVASWGKSAIFYHVHVGSFADSNGSMKRPVLRQWISPRPASPGQRSKTRCSGGSSRR